MPGSQTINKKGKKEVRIISTGAEKRCFTAVLACTAAGVMLPPMIIFKGKRELKKLKIPRGVVVRVQLKGWNDATLSNIWLQKVLIRHTKKKRALLVWDTFKGHLTDQQESELKKKQCNYCSHSRWLHKQNTAPGCVHQQLLQNNLLHSQVPVRKIRSLQLLEPKYPCKREIL